MFIQAKDRFTLDRIESTFFGVTMGTMMAPASYHWVTGAFGTFWLLLCFAALLAHRRAKLGLTAGSTAQEN